MSKICIVTATRAEYGLLKPVIKGLIEKKHDIRVAVTGAHLSKEHGLTYREIEEDGFTIDVKVDMNLTTDSAADISISMANALKGFAEYFSTRRPESVVILGDRYEMMSVAVAAMNEKIPIIHLYGGDVSEGAIDDVVRHTLTKMSLYHYTGTDEHRKRVIQMGESPDRVYSVGTLAAANALDVSKLSKEELESQLGFNWNPNSDKLAVITYHPVTLGDESVESQITELLKAIDRFDNLKCIITGANADKDGNRINELLKDYVKRNPEKAMFKESLGQVRYLSAISMADVVIGNSSSGLSEVPAYNVPTVNIGDRQKGRTAGKTVIACGVSANEISSAIETVLSDEFRDSIKDADNPYYKEGTVDALVNGIDDIMRNKSLDVRKSFYNITF